MDSRTFRRVCANVNGLLVGQIRELRRKLREVVPAGRFWRGSMRTGTPGAGTRFEVNADRQGPDPSCGALVTEPGLAAIAAVRSAGKRSTGAFPDSPHPYGYTARALGAASGPEGVRLQSLSGAPSPLAHKWFMLERVCVLKVIAASLGWRPLPRPGHVRQRGGESSSAAAAHGSGGA